MLKLPKRAKVFLKGVRGVHDPADPVAARERVLVRLEAALARGSRQDRAFSARRGDRDDYPCAE